MPRVLSLSLALLALAACDRHEPVATQAEDTGSDTLHALMIPPYLQSVTPDGAWILWVTETGEQSRVDYGPTPQLGLTASGQLGSDGLGILHEVYLGELESGTTYWYTVTTGGTTTQPLTFKTAPEPGSGTSFRVVAASDMQRDDAYPTKWAEIVADGVMPFLAANYAEDPSDAAGLMLLAGDLVDNGWLADEWTDDFFAGAAPIMGQVPMYPVPGNHEAGTPLFGRYFHLPENGTPGYEEQWWRHDYANARFIGLDSNAAGVFEEQLDWLDTELELACADSTVQFLFVELHHPYLSEPWTHGELDHTGDVVARLEEFSTSCGKPSAHLFGHTHAYSRGQSRDHDHLWINVAGGGGALDRWGSSEQVDYEQFSVSQDEYGFVVIEVEPEAFTVKRVSMGTPEQPKTGEVSDEVRVAVDADPPDDPTAVWPVDGQVLGETLQASAFSHGGGGAHGASHWQISADCEAFSDLAVDAWLQHENQFFGEDTQAGDDLTDFEPGELAAGEWCWRVRYRDRGLGWSGWSDAAAFEVE